jgi:hypothetical protein
LYDEIHPVAARYALHESDRERGLTIDRRRSSHRRGDACAANAFDGTQELSPIAAEQDEFVADTGA